MFNSSMFRAVIGASITSLFLVGLAITSAASSPGSSAAAGDCTADASLDGEEQGFLVLLNNHRAQNGKQPLAASYLLSKASQVKSQDMAANNYFAHDDLTRTWEQRIRDCGYGYNTYLGENIAAGISTAQQAFDLWKNSPGHNANMLSLNYTAVGIGRAYRAGSAYGWYWTTDFGGVADPWPATTPVPATSTPTRTNTPVAPPSITPTRTATPVAQPSSTPAPPSTLHIGDLDASTIGKSRWTARVTVYVHDASERPVANATVSGRWNGATSSSCITDAAGKCTLQSPRQAGSGTVTFSLTDLSAPGASYASASNHDVDGGSNGSVIVVVR